MKSIDQTVIETVVESAQNTLDTYLKESGAPEWVSQVITDLRLLDQVESQETWLFGEAGRNAELLPILNRLVVAACN